MMKRMAFALVLFCSALAYAGNSIQAKEARNHVGEDATVCGVVASAHYAASSRGRPTFINLDQPYPNQIFTIVIWEEDRAKFGNPEERYNDKNICVTGTITLYRGAAETTVREPGQITVQQ
jgi:hypothetical protein